MDSSLGATQPAPGAHRPPPRTRPSPIGSAEAAGGGPDARLEHESTRAPHSSFLQSLPVARGEGRATGLHAKRTDPPSAGSPGRATRPLPGRLRLASRTQDAAAAGTGWPASALLGSTVPRGRKRLHPFTPRGGPSAPAAARCGRAGPAGAEVTLRAAVAAEAAGEGGGGAGGRGEAAGGRTDGGRGAAWARPSGSRPGGWTLPERWRPSQPGRKR